MKRLPIFLMLALAAGAQTPTPVPKRTVRTFRYLADMDASAPSKDPFVYVQHFSSNILWKAPKAFRYDPTNSSQTNAIIRPVPSPNSGRRIHEWDGDVRAFGVTSEFPALATETATNQMDSRAMIQSAIDLMSERGGGIVRLPPGRVRIGGSLYMKPRVHLQGTVAPMGFTSPRSLASGQTSRLLAGTTLEMASANGIGEACLIFDGPRYFTNMFTHSIREL
jgi:hypothetical protein